MLSHKEAVEGLILGRTERLIHSLTEWNKYDYESEFVTESLDHLRKVLDGYA